MLMVFTFFLCLLFGCGKKSEQVNVPRVTHLIENKQNETNLPDFLNAVKINENVKEYFETFNKMLNFDADTNSPSKVENMDISYEIYYLGNLGDGVSGRYILARITSDCQAFIDRHDTVFSVDESNEIQLAFLDAEKASKYINEGKVLPFSEDSFNVGDAYNPIFKDFEEKDRILKQIKKLIVDRYFNQNPKSENEPVYYGQSKTKEVYVLDFDEGCWKYNQFRMIVYSEDGKVYRGFIWYSKEDKKFYFDEGTNQTRKGYKVSEVNEAESGELKEIADYCNRVKDNAICKMT